MNPAYVRYIGIDYSGAHTQVEPVFGCVYFDRPPQLSVENKVAKRVAILST